MKTDCNSTLQSLLNLVIEKDFLLTTEIEKFFESDLPGSFLYWKNCKGIFCGANNLLANVENNIIGKNDFECFWKKDAEFFRQNDCEALNQGKKTVLEYVPTASGTFTELSYKTRLYCPKEGLVGVLGLSLLLLGNELNISTLAKNQANLLTNKNPISPLFKTNDKNKVNYQLTSRQIECLYFLAKGMTAKQIGRELNISQRTIEHYLENLKNKLGCHSKYDLINKALEFTPIKDKLMETLNT
jgi:DNA-binding CsgD family transcriptional regulator